MFCLWFNNVLMEDKVGCPLLIGVFNFGQGVLWGDRSYAQIQQFSMWTEQDAKYRIWIIAWNKLKIAKSLFYGTQNNWCRLSNVVIDFSTCSNYPTEWIFWIMSHIPQWFLHDHLFWSNIPVKAYASPMLTERSPEYLTVRHHCEISMS